MLKMKVWELIMKLSKCPAGANVNVGVGATLNASADEFEFESDGEGEVMIRSSEDVRVQMDNGDDMLLSDLTATLA